MFAVSPVAFGTVPCPACGAALDPEALAGPLEATCPGCRAGISGQLFPAWHQPQSVPVSVSERALDGEAVCFFHPENRAALSCDRCGRFLCAICDLPVGSRHLCPACLSSGLGSEKLPEVVPWRFLWSRSAFWLGLIPLCASVPFWPVLIVTGPAAIIVALLGWKRAGSIPRGQQRGMAWMGIVLGWVQLAVWFGFIALIVGARSR